MADGPVVRFSYPTCIRLIDLLGQFWYEIDGACAREGIDPLDLPVPRLLALVYSWITEHIQYAKEDERAKFNDWLWAPPTGRDPDRVSQSVVDEEMSLFNAAARQNGALGG